MNDARATEGPASSAGPRAESSRRFSVAFLWLGWGFAAVLAIYSGYLALQKAGTEGELIGLREQAGLAEIEAQSMRQHLEAERILAAHQLKRAGASESASESAPRAQPLAFTDRAPDARGLFAPVGPDAYVVAAQGLPPPPSGQTYSAWLVDPQTKKPQAHTVLNIDDQRRGAAILSASQPQHPLELVVSMGSAEATEPSSTIVARAQLP